MIPKPQHLTDNIPRDVLMKIHFFPVKEQLMTKPRILPNLPTPYEGLYIFADLSQYTLQIRRQLKTVIKVLKKTQNDP